MKIEKQVCGFEQAKKLKELGCDVNLASFFFYYDGEHLCRNQNRKGHFLSELDYPAFTVAELGVMIGESRNNSHHDLKQTEAFARAEDLIHLLEIGELMAESCNERLKD